MVLKVQRWRLLKQICRLVDIYCDLYKPNFELLDPKENVDEFPYTQQVLRWQGRADGLCR